MFSNLRNGSGRPVAFGHHRRSGNGERPLGVKSAIADWQLAGSNDLYGHANDLQLCAVHGPPQMTILSLRTR